MLISRNNKKVGIKAFSLIYARGRTKFVNLMIRFGRRKAAKLNLSVPGRTIKYCKFNAMKKLTKLCLGQFDFLFPFFLWNMFRNSLGSRALWSKKMSGKLVSLFWDKKKTQILFICAKLHQILPVIAIFNLIPFAPFLMISNCFQPNDIICSNFARFWTLLYVFEQFIHFKSFERFYNSKPYLISL